MVGSDQRDRLNLTSQLWFLGPLGRCNLGVGVAGAFGSRAKKAGVIGLNRNTSKSACSNLENGSAISSGSPMRIRIFFRGESDLLCTRGVSSSWIVVPTMGVFTPPPMESTSCFSMGSESVILNSPPDSPPTTRIWSIKPMMSPSTSSLALIRSWPSSQTGGGEAPSASLIRTVASESHCLFWSNLSWMRTEVRQLASVPIGRGSCRRRAPSLRPTLWKAKRWISVCHFLPPLVGSLLTSWESPTPV